MFIVFGLAFLAFTFLLASRIVEDGWRRIWVAMACVVVVAALAIGGGLVFAQRPVCIALGGSWVPDEDACRNEWGGNGSNDSSEGVTF
jgi:hypothetical protein